MPKKTKRILLRVKQGDHSERVSLAAYCAKASAKNCKAVRALAPLASVELRGSDGKSYVVSRLVAGKGPKRRHRPHSIVSHRGRKRRHRFHHAAQVAAGDVGALERHYRSAKRDYHELGDQLRASRSDGK